MTPDPTGEDGSPAGSPLGRRSRAELLLLCRVRAGLRAVVGVRWAFRLKERALRSGTLRVSLWHRPHGERKDPRVSKAF